MPPSPQNRMSVAPATNPRHSAITKAIQSSNDKKSFIQRACSSPSIISLYQEPFIEPPNNNVDNSKCTKNSPGIISENAPIINKNSDETNLNYNSKYVTQTLGSNQSKQNVNDDPNKYDLKKIGKVRFSLPWESLH